jgi:hypothetical protein
MVLIAGACTVRWSMGLRDANVPSAHLRTLSLIEHRPVIEICRSRGRRSAPGTASPAFVETRYFESTATTTVGPEMANIAARVYPILGDVRGQPKDVMSGLA